MSQACSISTGKIYGLQRVCRVCNYARSTVYGHRQQRRFPRPVRRRGPKGPCCDEELAEHIRGILVESPFMVKVIAKYGQS